MSQHSSLSPERWSTFNLDQQILMIGNEMNRAAKLMGPDDSASRQRSYERVLRLVDLTVEVQRKRNLRRELLRWRDLVAALYAQPQAIPEEHKDVFRSLLLFTPTSARQIPLLLA
jgi:hypothetical protein